MKVDGSWYCGAIRFQAEVEPGSVWICHCLDCQALTGSAFRATILTPVESFVLHGEPKAFVRTTEDGTKKRLHFCETCGSPIFGSAIEKPAYYSLRVGTIRQRANLGAPALQMWCRSALGWAKLEQAPMFQSAPS